MSCQLVAREELLVACLTTDTVSHVIVKRFAQICSKRTLRPNAHDGHLVVQHLRFIYAMR